MTGAPPRSSSVPEGATFSPSDSTWRFKRAITAPTEMEARSVFDAHGRLRLEEYSVAGTVAERWAWYEDQKLMCFITYERGVARQMSFFIDPNQKEWMWKLERYCSCRLSDLPEETREIRLVQDSRPIQYEFFSEGYDYLGA